MKIWKKNSAADDLRQYLLGTLPQASQTRLEQRLMTDSGFHEEVQAAEDDLIDEYLAGTLNADERHQFESHFSIPEERQRKVRFGRTFLSYLTQLSRANSQRESELPKKRPSLAWLSTDWLSRRPISSVSLVVALSSVTFGVFWLAYRQQVQSRDSSQTLAVTLSPGSSRSGNASTQRIRQPVADSSVELQLEIGASEYPNYQVELLREGESLKVFKSLKAEPRSGHFLIKVPIDAGFLEVGDYYLKLSGVSNSSQLEFKDQYSLRVTP